MRVVAVVASAGTGKRMKHALPKPFMRLGGKPLLAYALKVLSDSPFIEKIIVVVSKANIASTKENIIKKYRIKKVISVTSGGKKRADSVYRGLKKITDEDLVLIHDGARPFLTEALIRRSIKAAREFGAAVAAVPVKFTIKKAGKDLIIDSSLNRSQLWEIQTPQVFKRELIIKAYRRRNSCHKEVSDDSVLVENLGHKVKLVKGSYANLKITTCEDLIEAEAILKFQRTKG